MRNLLSRLQAVMEAETAKISSQPLASPVFSTAWEIHVEYWADYDPIKVKVRVTCPTHSYPIIVSGHSLTEVFERLIAKIPEHMKGGR